MQDHTAPRTLSSTSNDFERNKRDVFTLVAVDVGEIQHVIVRKDDAGLSSDWHLQGVEIFHPGAINDLFTRLTAYMSILHSPQHLPWRILGRPTANVQA